MRKRKQIIRSIWLALTTAIMLTVTFAVSLAIYWVNDALDSSLIYLLMLPSGIGIYLSIFWCHYFIRELDR